MNDQLIIRQFGDQNLRIVDINGEPWFVAKDICNILNISNSRDAISGFNDDKKRLSILPTPGGNQELRIINESGLYSLVLRSRKPEAK